MAVEYEAFFTKKVKVTDAQIQIQGSTVDGKLREFELSFARNLVTNRIMLQPVRHYGDPESAPWFEDSEPWTEDEMRGDA